MITIRDFQEISRKRDAGILTLKGSFIEMGGLIGQLIRENEALREIGASAKGISRHIFDAAFDDALRMTYAALDEVEAQHREKA